MKKKVAIFFICLALMLGTATGVLAAGNMEAITAYLNRGIKIVYDGQGKTMLDTSGVVTYPISYKGTTYLPVRFISNMMGVDVLWDGKTETVYLGKIPGGIDFIENIKPYAQEYSSIHSSTSRKSIKEIAGKTYDHYIYIYDSLYYDLAGKYDSLVFKAYSNGSNTVYFRGDNDTLISSITVTGSELPKEYNVDLTGVQQLEIDSNGGTYLFDMMIE